jgi:hypothetical protein
MRFEPALQILIGGGTAAPASSVRNSSFLPHASTDDRIVLVQAHRHASR